MFMRNRCYRKCRSGCTTCAICYTHGHTTLGHPGAPTAEIEPQERELSDIEAQAIANEFEKQAYLRPELLRGIDLPEGQLAAKGRILAERYGGEAARLLGSCYSYGRGVPKDSAEAIRWYRLGVERRDTLSAVRLGEQYEELDIGSGVLRHSERAARWFRYAGDCAIENNDSVSMHALGNHYHSIYPLAFKWYSLSADLGHADSMYRLAECYESSRGVEMDVMKAAHWYTHAAEHGHKDAKIRISRWYEQGLFVPRDYVRSYAWLKRTDCLNKDESMSTLAAKMTPEQIAEAERFAEQEIIPKNALAGDADSQWELAQLHIGKGELAEAIKWLRLAANKGHRQAQRTLDAQTYYDHLWSGDANKESDAARWLLALAEQGDIKAARCLGVAYRSGRGVSQNPAEAAKWWSVATENGDISSDRDEVGILYHALGGDAQSQWELGRRYWARIKFTETLNWYRLAAEQGHTQAQWGMCSVLSSTLSGLPKNEADAEAAKWMKILAGKGDLDAMRMLGDAFRYGRGVTHDMVEATSWWRTAAEKGDLLSAAWLGSIYNEGEGLAPDRDEAMRWFKAAGDRALDRAADGRGSEEEQGWATLTMSALGDAYACGVLCDPTESFRWHSLAAERGNTTSMVELAQLYREGSGVEKNLTKMVGWYRKAAENGNDLGKVELADCYREGLGVPRDYVQAYAWLKRCKSFMLEHFAPGKLELLAGKMTPEQVAQAERLADERTSAPATSY